MNTIKLAMVASALLMSNAAMAALPVNLPMEDSGLLAIAVTGLVFGISIVRRKL